MRRLPHGDRWFLILHRTSAFVRQGRGRPPFHEGFPTLVGTTWFSLSGPPKLPAEIVEKLNAEVGRIVALPEVLARFRRDGFISQPMSPAEFTRYVGAEAARWKPLVEKAGLAGKGG